MDILVVVIKVIPQERVSMRIVAQIVDLPAPQIMKESIEVPEVDPSGLRSTHGRTRCYALVPQTQERVQVCKSDSARTPL